MCHCETDFPKNKSKNLRTLSLSYSVCVKPPRLQLGNFLKIDSQNSQVSKGFRV